MQRQTHRVHFEDFSGDQFERLCFAFFVRRYPTADISWYGQLGGDHGRDISCNIPDSPPLIVQCANFARLTLKKVQDDLAKIANGPAGTQVAVHLVCGGTVSAKLRDRITANATTRGFLSVNVWSGSEFEEQLRTHSPELLRRFVDGDTFPELPEQLVALARTEAQRTDSEIVRSLAQSFDRPAFKTHFYQESSLPRFKEAIADTIRTLNTGQMPSGAKIPSRHDIRDPRIREAFEQLVALLVRLRAEFDQFLRTGEIRPCGCNQPDCPVFMLEPAAAHRMDRLREDILRRVSALEPSVHPYFY